MRVALVGSGSLALGLLHPWLSRIPSCELSVVRRRSGGDYGEAFRRSQRFRLKSPAGATVEELHCVEYDPADLTAPTSKRCLARLAESDVVAVSVGVSALPAVAPLVAHACLGDRPRPLHVLAFENTPGASQRLCTLAGRELARLGVEESRRRLLVPHSAIPDRACTRSLETDGVVVRIERFGEVLLERTAEAVFEEVKEPSVPQPRVLFIDPEAVELGEKRKFWLVNGTHTALGVLCAVSGKQVLIDLLEEPAATDFMRQLHAEWVRILARIADEEGLARDMFTAHELASHAEMLFDRLRDLPGFTLRHVLKELTLPENRDDVPPVLARLVQKLDDRLAQQVREAFKRDVGPVPFSGWMLATGVGVARQHTDRYLI